jgi:hypothetical protein
MLIPGNEIADEEAKNALEDNLLATEKYSPQDLINWIKTEDSSGALQKLKGDRCSKRRKLVENAP